MFHWQFLIPMFSLYISSLNFGASYIKGQWEQVQSKECHFLFTYTFLAFFIFLVSSKILYFFHFHSFFDEVSNFWNRILTNQKPEVVIRNCQWNCMFFSLHCKHFCLISMHDVIENSNCFSLQWVINV